MLRDFVEQSFLRAVENEENFFEGKLNMDFVEADVYMDCKEQFGDTFSPCEYLDMFDVIAENFSKKSVDNSQNHC